MVFLKLYLVLTYCVLSRDEQDESAWRRPLPNAVFYRLVAQLSDLRLFLTEQYIDSAVGDCKRFAIVMLIVENPPNLDSIFGPLCPRCTETPIISYQILTCKATFGAQNGLCMISWSHKWLLMAVIRCYACV